MSERPTRSGRDEAIDALTREVENEPRRAGARMRLGIALLEAGRIHEAATELLLAAKLEPHTPQAALLASDALLRADRARDAALLLSAIVHPQRGTTLVTDDELRLLETLLIDRDPFVRCHVARALGRLRVAQAVDALERASLDENAAVHLAVQTSLRQLLAC